ncbi:MAG: transketolase [Eubacteriales bacterium]|nr:transketolase [Eubacteriales bacterium]
MKNSKALAAKLRADTLRIIRSAGGGHIGGDLSVMDILTELYFRQMKISPENQNDPERDLFVLSKGHSVEAYYAVLAEKGFFSLDEVLGSIGTVGTPFIGHPNNKLPGIEMNSGSLGHGLPVCVGMALGQRMLGRSARVYTVLGDGELAEGSVWEAAMAAGHYKLDNLCAVVDRNGLQISGPTETVMTQDPQLERWSAFGWHAIPAHGNDPASLHEAFTQAKQTKGKPTVIVAHTVKGCGVSFMENRAEWHHRMPTDDEFVQAFAELAAAGERALDE